MTVVLNFDLKFQVPGNFHVATHSADKQPDKYDFAHEIHELSFGSKIKKISSKGIGSFNSLGGRDKLDSSSEYPTDKFGKSVW